MVAVAIFCSGFQKRSLVEVAQFSLKMAGYTANYEYNGVIYSVNESFQIHQQLQNDSDFACGYFRENAPATEIVGAAETSESDTVEFVWTKKATMLLIHLYRERLVRFRDPKQKKKLLWGEMIIKFVEHGYTGLTEDTLDRKFRNMKKTYTTIKDNNKKTGTGRGRVAWEYFEDFNQIFEEDRTVNFGHKISSMEPASSEPPFPAQTSSNTHLTADKASMPATSAHASVSALRTHPSQNEASMSSTSHAVETPRISTDDFEFLRASPIPSKEKGKRGKN